MASLIHKVIFKEHITGEEAGTFTVSMCYELGQEAGHLAGTDMETVILNDHDGGKVYEVSRRLCDIHGCEYVRVKE